MKKLLFIPLLLGFLACTEQEQQKESAFNYPDTKKDTTVVDEYFQVLICHSGLATDLQCGHLILEGISN